MNIGLLTPPVGSVLFVGSAVGKLPIEQVVRASLASRRPSGLKPTASC